MQPNNNAGLDPSSNPNLPNSAADDAALKAIEALEAETSPVLEPSESTPPVTPPVTPPEPVSPSIAPPATPEAPAIPADSLETTAPQPQAAPSDSVQSSVARELNEGQPAPTTTFQPFVKQKRSKTPLVVLAIILGLGLLGAGGYFGWQYFQNNNTTPPAQNQGQEETEQDSADSVNSSIDMMQDQLNGLDDAEYQDSTLSDESLYED